MTTELWCDGDAERDMDQLELVRYTGTAYDVSECLLASVYALGLSQETDCRRRLERGESVSAVITDIRRLERE